MWWRILEDGVYMTGKYNYLHLIYPIIIIIIIIFEIEIFID